MSTKRRTKGRCRRWLPVPPGWVHAAGRQRLRCALPARHRGRGGACETADGWLWQPGTYARYRTVARRVPRTDRVPALPDRYPERIWTCQGCATKRRSTENAARAYGWHVRWAGAVVAALCRRCAHPAPPPPAL